MPIIRALLRTYYPATHTADVEPTEGPATLLSALPVLMSTQGAHLVAGRAVAVQMWTDIGGVVLGPYSALPSDWNCPQDLTVTRDLQVNRNAHVDGTLHADGALDTDAALHADGAIDSDTTIHADGNIDTDANLIVDGKVGIGTGATTPEVELVIVSPTDVGNRGVWLKNTANSASTTGFQCLKERATGKTALDNDYAGTLNFAFYNDAATPAIKLAAYLASQVLDASATTEDGNLSFVVMTAGVLTELLRLVGNSVLIGNTTGSARLEVNNGTVAQAIADFQHNGASLLKIDDADKLAFFGVATVARQAHTIDADGTLADLTTKFNALLAKLEAYGLLATS